MTADDERAVPPRERLTLYLVGDIAPMSRLTAPPDYRQPLRTLERYSEMFHAADLTIASCEVAFTDLGMPREKMFTMRADPRIAADIGCLGIDVATVANNHSLDYGWSALHQSIAHLNGGGVEVIGAGTSLEEASRPAMRHARGWSIGVLPFSCLLPVGVAATPSTPGISPLRIETSYEIDPLRQVEEPGDPAAVRVHTRVRSDDLERACTAVASEAANSDLVIASIHWGFGAGDDLADYQRPLAHALIDAGADIIHGHHMHSPQAVEFYRGSPILYGSNGFISQDTLLSATPEVAALNAEMSPDGFVTRVLVCENRNVELSVWPFTLDDERLPRPDADAFDRVRARLLRLSTELGTRIMDADDWLILESGDADAQDGAKPLSASTHT